MITPAIREPLSAAAVSLAREAGYVGAGTVEFLVSADDPSEWFFLEVNARLQVEHPVTEMVTGLDLVEQQLLVAAGAPLAFAQDDVAFDGHAIEVRVCAEDPAVDFLPATGELVGYREPHGAGIRVDSGVEEGSRVTPFYDSLLLKVIAHGADRDAAIERLDLALGELRLLGAADQRRLPAAAGRARPGPRRRHGHRPDRPRRGRDAAAGVRSARSAGRLRRRAQRRAAQHHRTTTRGGPWSASASSGPAPVSLEVAPRGGDPVHVSVSGTAGEESVTIGATREDAGETFTAGPAWAWDSAASDGETWVAAGPEAFAFRLVEPVVEGDARRPPRARSRRRCRAPSWSCASSPGETVAEGQVLVVIESMKMEMSLTAPTEATVADVLVAAGEGVKQGQSLVELEPVA